MKFEVTYADTSKVIVDVPDSALREFLDRKAKDVAVEAACTNERKRGAPVSLRVV